MVAVLAVDPIHNRTGLLRSTVELEAQLAGMLCVGEFLQTDTEQSHTATPETCFLQQQARCRKQILGGIDQSRADHEDTARLVAPYPPRLAAAGVGLDDVGAVDVVQRHARVSH